MNLATGAEDYTPSPDLVSYNPVGPAAIFSRSYHSLSNPMPTGLGSGWSHSYNYRIVRTQGTSGYSQPVFVYPNGSQVPLTFPVYQTNKPSTDQVATVPAGVSLRVVWRSITGFYEVTFADGSTWEFRELLGKNTGSLTYRFSMPCKISDREASPTVARYVTLLWNVMDTNSPDPFTGTSDFNAVLTDISASNYELLMLFNYSNGNLDAVFEPTTQTSASLSTARGVSYNYQSFASTGVTTGPTSTTGLTRVAMIGPVRAVVDGWALDPTDACYAYGYGNYGTGTAAQTVAYLKSISVPSPSSVNANKVWNGGVATAYINYNSVTGAVTSLVDANGNTTTITPEVQNNILIRTSVQTTDSIGTIQSKYYVYWNANMLETQRTVPLGASQLYTPSVPTYGDPQNPFLPSSITTATGQVTQFTWDRYGNLRSRTSPRGTVTTLSYDETVFPYRLISVQEGTKTPTTIAYDTDGLVSSVTSPRPYDGVSAAGATDSTTFTYSTKKQLKTVTQPGPTGTLRTTTFEYETDGSYTQPERIGQPIVVTNPTGKKTRFRYNVRGNELESIDPAGFRTTRTFDLTDAPTHQYVSTTDGTGMRLATRQTYLYLGGPQTVEFSYDNAGTTVIRTQWSDLLNEGQILRNTGRGHSATSQIDSMSRLLGVTDEKSQVSNFGHDLAGQLINIRYPTGANNIRDTLTFGYDGSGRATSRIDAQSRTTTYLYNDPGGLRSGTSYSSSGTTPEDLTYTYDAYDRVSQVSNGTAIESFTYDDGDFIKTHTVTYLVPGTVTQVPAQTVSYTYWPDGSRKTMTALGRTWSYTYDLAGLCTGMSVSSLGSFGYQYTDAGLVTKRTTPSGLVTDQAYFSSGTLASVTNRQSASGPILSQFTVPTTGYNGVFQLTNLTASHPSSTGLNGTIQYVYDAKDQLASETTTRGGGITKNYGYDLAGNLGTAANFNANNQPTLAGYGFDRDGNATLYQSVAFTYNRENRLTSAGSLLTCAWRPDGLRGWKSNGTLRSYFVYDGKLPISEIDASGAVLAVNVHGPAGLETRIDGTTPRYFTYDLRGNAVQSISSTGTVAWTATYDAYGTYSASGVVSGPFRFGARWGYYLDSEVGLYLCSQRFYDAGTGRWLTRDPISYEGGMNLYAYCENDPIQWTDPSGLDFVRSAIAYAAMSSGHRRAAELNKELQRKRKFPLHKDFYYWVDFDDTVRLHWPDMPPVEEFMFLEAMEAVKISYHRHHVVPQEVSKHLRQKYRIEVPEFKVTIKMEARDHLKNIHHGDGGGEFNKWWRKEIEKIEAQRGKIEAKMSKICINERDSY